MESQQAARASRSTRTKKRRARKAADGLVIDDPRFSSVHSDPRFREPKRRKKVLLDKRFQSLLKSDKFVPEFKFDKHGEHVRSSQKEEMSRLFTLSEDEEEAGGVGSGGSSQGTESLHVGQEEEQSSGEEADKGEDAKVHPLIMARYHGFQEDGSGSSTSEAELDFGGFSDEEEKNPWKVLEEDETPTISAETCRLAVQNCDWEQIHARDLYVLFASCVSDPSDLISVTVYPSMLGLERMRREEEAGPLLPEGTVLRRETKGRSKSCSQLEDHTRGDSSDEEPLDAEDEDEDEEEEEEEVEVEEEVDDIEVEGGGQGSSDGPGFKGGLDYDPDKLREYELTKLKYYYAVAVFSSPKVARHVYDQCDGVELEKTGNILDLRFIPDDVLFDQPPKEICDRPPSTYKALDFSTAALQQTSVELTWDRTDPSREKVLVKRRFTPEELRDMDFEAYLASDSSSDESTPSGKKGTQDNTTSLKAEKAAKYRQLLQSLRGEEDKDDFFEEMEEDSEDDAEMEFGTGNMGEESASDVDKEDTFVAGSQDLAQKLRDRVDAKLSGQEEKSVWEKYLDKRKEKKRAHKERIKELKRKRNAQSGSEEEDGDDADSMYAEDERMLTDPFFKSLDEEIPRAPPKEKKKRNKQKKSGGKEEPSVGAGEEAARQRQTAELELMAMDGEGTDSDDEELALRALPKRERRKMKKELRKRKEESFSVDLSDPRFSKLFDGAPEFSLDPTNPNFKKTKGTLEIQEEIKRRKKSHAAASTATAPGNAHDRTSARPASRAAGSSLQLLADTIKKKALPAHVVAAVGPRGKRPAAEQKSGDEPASKRGKQSSVKKAAQPKRPNKDNKHKARSKDRKSASLPVAGKGSRQ